MTNKEGACDQIEEDLKWLMNFIHDKYGLNYREVKRLILVLAAFCL